MTYTGRCVCGAVTLDISADPIAVRQCWCRQCQQIAAGSPTINAIFPKEAVTIEGTLGHSQWAAASGNTLTFHFCPSCGTQVYGQSSARQHLMTVRVGMIDEPHGLRPEMIIWTDDAPVWACLDPHLPQWPQMPPPPAPPPAPTPDP